MRCKDRSNRGSECTNEAEVICRICEMHLCNEHVDMHYKHGSIERIDRNTRLEKIKLQLMSIKMQTLLNIEKTTLKIKNDLILEIEDLMIAQNYVLENVHFYSECLEKLLQDPNPTDSSLDDIKLSFNQRFSYKSSRKIVEIGLLFLDQLNQIEKSLKLSRAIPSTHYLPQKEVISERLVTSYPYIFDLNEFDYLRKFHEVDLSTVLFTGVIETLVNFMETTKEFKTFNEVLSSLKFSLLPDSLLSLASIDNIPMPLIKWINNCCDDFSKFTRNKKLHEILREFSQIFNIQIYFKYDSYKKVLEFKRNDCFLKLFLANDESTLKLFVPKKQNYYTLSWKQQMKGY